MSARRVKNILTGDWVINSPDGRLNRPWKGGMDNVNLDELEKKRKQDPLAPGAVKSDGSVCPNYEFTYIFPNDFPVFDNVNVENKDEINEDDLFITQSCRGVSHVMCYSPDFYKHFAQMKQHELEKVYDGWLQFFAKNKTKFEYIQIFENRGIEVGSSLPHPHCQIWSTTFLPTTIEKTLHNQEVYYKKHGSSMLPDYVKQELNKEARVVADLEHFVVLVPYWAYWPYELMIIAKREVQRIDQFSKEEQADFMKAVQLVAGKYDTFFEGYSPYVMGIRNAPVGSYLEKDLSFWQFHVNFYPPLLVRGRKKFMAGYELLSEVQRDFKVETAAERLRNVSFVPNDN
ncbi:unnamed protein product [Bursaphelenchus okinawaensis]|uniref:Galactose-1-phosphate uridylyltransferase n=1 Tax=Bursaphelenchus okinawaensis TaxID=465554 RepID=A0A811KJL7_9BILA|nr:unnamed protein product [Bursaphelenchus okinawaensis]CAG9104278.1 unnamed protein product [Bursaphelenchus okinawaensis]